MDEPRDYYEVTPSTQEDPRFKRHGRDLCRVETIDVVDAVLGTAVDVPALD